MEHKLAQRIATGVVAAIGLAGAVSVSRAQSLAQFETYQRDTMVRSPKAACRDLRNLTGFDLSIDTATLVSAQGNAPEVCVVQGQIQPEVRFEVSLPSSWNGRLYMFGNGGFAGEALDAPARLQRRDAALRNGFAVTQTNTGHDATREPQASFALQSQKLIDYAYRAVHVSAIAAKRVIRTYYDGPPVRSYFAGCSTGGRQGLISAQRFPEDFDGILVGAPVLDFPGIMVQFAKAQRALAETPLSADKVQYLSGLVHLKCDAVDGVSDGVIDDPRRCSIDLAKDAPVCAGGENRASCLTAAEIKALRVFGEDVLSGSSSIFPAFPTGTAILAPDVLAPGSSVAHWVGQGGQQPGSLRFTENFFKHLVAPGTELDWRAFSPDRDLDKLKTIAALLNATDPDLSRFRNRGGKIIMYHGWAEPQINPLLSVNYRQRVQDTMGPSTDDFLRLFMMPGVLHCTGGVGPDMADMMTPLVNWVERNVAPSRIVAARRVDGRVVRTRPLCAYPQVAKYTGGGSTDDASNFVCRNP